MNRVWQPRDSFNSSDVSFAIAEDQIAQPEAIEELAASQSQRWEALMRGQIIAATIQKLFNYITIADQKAQMIIILNSIMIPLALSEMNDPDLKIGATIAIITAIISIFLSILCIYPKRRSGRKPDGSINHLHFADIGMLKEKQYMESFFPIYNDKARLTEEAVKDLHDVSRRILLPKFRWLKLAYISFFLGYFIAISYTLAHSWFGFF